MTAEKLAGYRAALAGQPAAEILGWALREFGRDRLVLASSLGAEDQALTDLLLGLEPAARILTLDTGRLFPETYEVMQKTRERYGVRYEVLAPDPADLAAMVAEHGPNLFYESVEKRKLCCEVRKLRPLSRGLAGVAAWICGLRSGQAATRQQVEAIEWDAVFGLYKLNPLHDWSETRVWDYLREHKVPYNALHERGFPSIGCACCTRAILPGEDIRAGRWWWESPEKRECGLHWQDGKVVKR